MSASSDPPNKYDIVLFGASGFTGKLVAGYLARHPQRGRFSWAIAGRNADKLRRLRESLSAGTHPEPGVIVADAYDMRSVSAMVSLARVVLTAAGPYSTNNGRSLVDCCAREGRDYVDLSGEYGFQREMIDRYHDLASITGARIVLAAGIDSIPSDLGSQFAIEQIEAAGMKTGYIKALYTDYAGSFSGGTFNTMRAMEKAARSAKSDKAFHRNPYVLVPQMPWEDTRESVAGWDRVRFDRDFNRIGGPFFMAPINARIVRRSLALAKRLPCHYEEGIALTAWLKAFWLLARHGFGLFAGQPVPLRPGPGQGPPAWLRERGRFRLLIKAFSRDGGRWVLAEVNGRGDPGYGATSKMFAEAGLCLLLHQAGNRATGGGALTPASALGPILRERLTAVEDGTFMQFRLLERY